MPETAETIIEALKDDYVRRKPTHTYAVLEESYNGKRVIFKTNDKDAADRVAEQSPARKVMVTK
jgi:hypothetical protein